MAPPDPPIFKGLGQTESSLHFLRIFPTLIQKNTTIAVVEYFDNNFKVNFFAAGGKFGQ